MVIQSMAKLKQLIEKDENWWKIKGLSTEA
jgi:hypothetical protein